MPLHLEQLFQTLFMLNAFPKTIGEFGENDLKVWLVEWEQDEYRIVLMQDGRYFWFNKLKDVPRSMSLMAKAVEAAVGRAEEIIQEELHA